MCTETVQHSHHRLSHNASLGLTQVLSLEGPTPMTEMILCDSRHWEKKGRLPV